MDSQYDIMGKWWKVGGGRALFQEAYHREEDFIVSWGGGVYVLPYPFAVSHFLYLLNTVRQAAALGWSPHPVDWHFWISEPIETLPSYVMA